MSSKVEKIKKQGYNIAKVIYTVLKSLVLNIAKVFISLVAAI